MTTANEVITAAFKLLGRLDLGEAPDAREAEDALAELNDMMHGWTVSLQYTHTTLALTDTVNLAAKHIGTLKAMLAERIAPLINTIPAPHVLQRAADGWISIMADTTIGHEIETVDFDTGLTAVSADNRLTDYDGING